MARKHFAWLVVTLLATSRLMATEFPYSVETAAARTIVRSGPGEAFYATSELPAGMSVEVYREAANDWLAIRPPQDSFSYVRARHLELAADRQTASVAQSGIKTRIGSRFSTAHNVEYVALKQGERLRLLSGPLTIGSDPQAWYKVAPPSGEFRWIHRSQVLAADSLPPSPAAMPDIEAIPLAESVSPATSSTASPNGATATAGVDRQISPNSSRRVVASRSPAPIDERHNRVNLEELTNEPTSMVTQPIPKPRVQRDMPIGGIPNDDLRSEAGLTADEVQLTGIFHWQIAPRQPLTMTRHTCPSRVTMWRLGRPSMGLVSILQRLQLPN